MFILNVYLEAKAATRDDMGSAGSGTFLGLERMEATTDHTEGRAFMDAGVDRQ